MPNHWNYAYKNCVQHCTRQRNRIDVSIDSSALKVSEHPGHQLNRSNPCKTSRRSCCSPLLFPPSALRNPLPRATNPTPQNISGKWSGSLEIHRPDGEVNQTAALLILNQSGDTVTGTVGPNEEDQLHIIAGKVSGSDIQLTAEMHDGTPNAFHFHLEGDHLKGDLASNSPDGKITGKLDLTRETPAPPAAPAKP